jgi:hypothetical protein
MAATTNTLPEKFLSHVSSVSSPKVKEVYEALSRFAAAPARSDWIKQAGECKKAALENEFFSEKEKTDMARAGQAPHIHNRLVLGVQGASAVATSQRPDIKVFPLRESDPYLAELCKSALEHVWLKNYGNDVVFDVVEERNLSGIGAIYARRDPNKGPFGAVVFEEEKADDWYWDEGSRKRDRSDTHLIKAKLRSIGYIKANYDLKDEEIVSIDDDFETGDGPVTDTLTSGDNYKRGQENVPPDADKKRRVWEIEAHMLKTEREHWVVVTSNDQPHVFRLVENTPIEAKRAVEELKSKGVVELKGGQRLPITDAQYWPRTLNNRYTRIIVGSKLIPQKDAYSLEPDKERDEVKNMLGLDSDGDPVLPVTFYYGQRLPKAYYRSPTFYALGPNKSLCKRQTQYTLAISKNLSAPPIRESTGTRWRDPEHPDAPGNELLIDKSARVPTRLQPGVIDFAALTNHIEEDKMAIDDAYSLPEVMRGKIPKGIERMSGRLGLALQDTGTIMHNPAIRGLESCLERTGKALLSIILRSWPRSKWESLITDDRVNEFRAPNDQAGPADADKGVELLEKERQERLKRWEGAIEKATAEGISIVDFNIAITAGSSLPTNRLLKEETARENFKLGLYDRRAALEHSGEPHAKEIAARMDKRELEMAQAGIKQRRG